jgi:UDP-N-acetylmuramyl pentapeptide phosphotransferase/UDP-N-acetylglucosamine-1-phosphate transferase
LAINAFSFAFTVFAVAGVTHAVNVIDGLNGLSSVNALLASIGLAVVAWTVGDSFVFSAACVLGGSVAGFFLVNYPGGRIFLGDGGAYLMGLLLAELAVLLVHRNSEVSPWFPLLLLAYPIWETLFSMYRRKVRGRSAGEADALHLHSLVYHRLARWKGYFAAPSDYVARNSIASACLWVLPASCLGVALSFWGNSLVLLGAAVIFAIFYTRLYLRIVRFGMPGWMTISSRSAMAPRASSGQHTTA